MNGISLFTGDGAGELAIRNVIPDYRTILYVEKEKHCQQVIQARIRDGVLDDAPIWDDIKTFDAKEWAGKVDFISAGFPCQPFSNAGLMLGEADERNMWPETRDAISDIQPRYVFLENVTGLFTSQYIWTILSDITEIGYDSEWDIVGADFLDMRLHRKRGWILLQRPMCREQALVRPFRGNGRQSKQVSWHPHSTRKGEPPMVGMVNGLASRMDRLRALGNGQIPPVVANILRVQEIT